MKICVTCSPGGHLTEALQILPALKKHKVFFYTIYTEHTKQILKSYKKYFISNPIRNPIKYLSVIASSFSTLIKERPRVIISFGAGPTLPISLLSKLLFGCKLIYVECSAQVYEPSLTGKIIYPFSDLFFVQWNYLKEKFGNKAIFGGLLI